MTLEQELETTLAAAGRHARPDEEAVAVMATEPAGARATIWDTSPSTAPERPSPTAGS
jgi:hypothetical protein